MTLQDDCEDRVRFSLSDETGELRFTSFQIVDVPDCKYVEREVVRYLVGRPLADVDPHYVRGLACPGDGQCMEAVAEVIEESQRLFLHYGIARSHELRQSPTGPMARAARELRTQGSEK